MVPQEFLENNLSPVLRFAYSWLFALRPLNSKKKENSISKKAGVCKL